MRIRLQKVKRLPTVPAWMLFVAAGGLGILIPGILLYSRFHPPVSLCLLKNLAGLPCPACGLGRSFFALGRGEIGAAFLFHPFGFCAGVFLAGLFILRIVCGRTPVINATRLERLLVVASGALLFLTNWAYLILSGR